MPIDNTPRYHVIAHVIYAATLPIIHYAITFIYAEHVCRDVNRRDDILPDVYRRPSSLFESRFVYAYAATRATSATFERLINADAAHVTTTYDVQDVAPCRATTTS